MLSALVFWSPIGLLGIGLGMVVTMDLYHVLSPYWKTRTLYPMSHNVVSWSGNAILVVGFVWILVNAAIGVYH